MPSEIEKTVCRHTRRIIAGKSNTNTYFNEDKSKHVDITTSTYVIYKDTAIHTTIGFFNTDIGLYDNSNRSIRIELICVSDKEDDIAPKVMATVAFEIMDSESPKCDYGRIYKNVITAYDESYEMKHIILLAPVFWNHTSRKHTSLEAKDMVVKWLMLFPISDQEKEYIENHGVQEFEKLLEKQKTDVTNRKRKSFL